MPGTPGTGNARQIPIHMQKICSLCQAWENNNDCQAQENKQRLASAGKQAAISKRGKTSNDCQARENKQRLPSAGKQATIAKRGENKQRLPSAGKQATGVKRWKTIDGFRECKNHAMNVKRMLLAEKEFYILAKALNSLLTIVL